MATVKKMTTSALTTFNSLDRAVDFETPDSKTFRMLYNTKTQGFAVASLSSVIQISNKYAQVNKIGDYNGQCVSFVKAMCGINTATSTWIRGTQLTPTLSIMKGTAIATFTGVNNTYDGSNTTGQAHTGIFIGFYSNLSTGEKGIEIFDQNWGEGGTPAMIGRIHRIPFNSSASGAKADAGRYYILTIGLSSSLQKFVWGTPHTFLIYLNV